MLHFNEKQFEVLSDNLPDTANVVLAGTVVGQAVTGQGFSIGLALVGLALWAGLIGMSLLLALWSTR